MPKKPAPKRTARIDVYEDAEGQHRWRLLAANGAIVAQGEGHTTPSNARRAARGMLKAAATAVFAAP